MAELNNEPSEGHQGTNLTRRRVVKAALSTPPVLATLTSKPVQAVQGLSNMLSGDASVCRGDDRYGGQSPGFWLTPSGATDDNTPHRPAWEMTGFWYSDEYRLKPIGFKFKPEYNQWSDFSGGTLFNDAFLGIMSIANDRPLRVVLGEENNTPLFHYIAALLNIKYLESVGQKYIFSLDQFRGLVNGTIDIPPGYASLEDLISSHYHEGPGDSCTQQITI